MEMKQVRITIAIVSVVSFSQSKKCGSYNFWSSVKSGRFKRYGRSRINIYTSFEN